MLTLEYLSSLDKETQIKVILKEYIKCMKDPLYTITNYFPITDPDTGVEDLFNPYPYQKKAIKAFEDNKFNMTMKTRQTGLTTVTQAYVAWFMATKKKKIVNALAQEKKVSKKFLTGVRGFLDGARKRAPWLIPEYIKGNDAKESFGLSNGSTILAEANKPEACRGETISLLIIDEVAAITWMDSIWASAGLTLARSQGGCIAISTPKGSQGWYFDQYTNAEENGWNIIDAHWSEHPIFNMGLYRWIEDKKHPDGGYVHFMNDTFPDMTNNNNVKRYRCKSKEDYNFVRDGRIRSPWYDFESKKLGPRKTRCELDCSFAGSGGEVLNPEIIREHELLSKDFTPINTEKSGVYKNYRQYKKYIEGHKYAIASDVATGDGSDFSAFVVMDITKLEIVATYKDQFESTKYAEILNKIGREYGNAILIVEHQFGLSVLLTLRDQFKYTNLFYSTLKKDDPSTKDKKRKIGFWQSEKTRSLGGDKLEELINSKELIIPCPTIIAELHTWIWSKRGRRDHAPTKHDDLIMSLTVMCFYVFYIDKKQADYRDGMKKVLERHTVNLGSTSFEDSYFDMMLE